MKKKKTHGSDEERKLDFLRTPGLCSVVLISESDDLPASLLSAPFHYHLLLGIYPGKSLLC